MISVGLIGCGDVAEYGHLPTIIEHQRFRLAAVCDLNRDRAELLAARAGAVPVYTDWRELLNREKLDAAVLALPPEISPDIVEECLGRKLAVLDEKPLAANVEDGRRLARLVTQSKCVYQIGFVLRYGDWVEEIRRLTASLGSPLRIRVAIYDERLDPANETHYARIQGFLKNSSALTHEGSHVIDYVSLWNPSQWTRVSAFAQQTSPAFSGPNVWNAQVNFEDLSTLNVKIAWLLPELPPSTITIEGPSGRLGFECRTGRGEYEVEEEHRSLSFGPVAPEWKRQYDAFLKAIEHGHAEFATVADAARALDITAACEMSAKTGRIVTQTDFQRRDDQYPADIQALPSSPAIGRHSISADKAADV